MTTCHDVVPFHSLLCFASALILSCCFYDWPHAAGERVGFGFSVKRYSMVR